MVLLTLWVLEANVFYPHARPRVGKSFKGVKRQTVPNQSLTLKEIVKRFVRRESLPVSRDGIYEERFGDLEKIKHADITEQMDRIAELKAQIANWNKRVREKQERMAKIKADMDAAAKATSTNPAQGVEPLKNPPSQGA